MVSLAPQVSQLENDLSPNSSSKAAFPHLYRLRNLPFAYSASVVEIVRRKEFGQFLSSWTSRLGDVLAKFTSAESSRRQKIREDVISHLPFSLPVLDDTMRIAVELNVSTGLDVLKSVTLDRQDVDGESRPDLPPWLMVQVSSNGSNRYSETRIYWTPLRRAIWVRSELWKSTLVLSSARWTRRPAS